MLSKLILDSGQDIPFPEGELVIHPPQLREIAMIGEQTFLTGLNFLTFAKESLIVEDKSVLDNQNDFDIFMTVINSNSDVFIDIKDKTILLLQLLFPIYKVQIMPESILFYKQYESVTETGHLDKFNFQQFKDCVKEIFCWDKLFKDLEPYNPEGARAEMLAKKFEDRKKKIAELNPDRDEEDNSIFYRFVSILAVGENKDKNKLMKYTVFQIFDEYNRYIEKMNYDDWFSAKLAGAKDLKTPDNWMK